MQFFSFATILVIGLLALARANPVPDPEANPGHIKNNQQSRIMQFFSFATILVLGLLALARANPMPEPEANPGDMRVNKCTNCNNTEINYGSDVTVFGR
ncbi:hypothetical protein ACLKA6_014078 [Drosophila palustris]